MIQNLADAGCDRDKIRMISCLYAAGNIQDTIRVLRCHKCMLMDQLHESQSRVDCLDYLVYNLEKELKNQKQERME